MSGEAVLRLEGVTVRRGDAVLLSSVDVCIEAVTCTALVGPSGAGKSTLLRLLNRFEDPTDGVVSFRGQPLHALDVLQLRRSVVLVAQRPALLTDVVADEVRVAAPNLTDDDVAGLLERVGLSGDFLTRTTGTLSGGEAQRLCLARALAVRPEVLLLDEPTSSLDAASAELVEESVAALVRDGMTVVLVSHDVGQARRLSRRAVVLRSGLVVEQGVVSDLAYLQEAS